MKHQQSCTPNTGNGGNFYHYNAAYAGDNYTWAGEAINSICPANWILPRFEKNKSYSILASSYNATTGTPLLLNNPVSFILSGMVDTAYGGPRRGDEWEGFYWTFLSALSGNPGGDRRESRAFKIGRNYIDTNSDVAAWNGVPVRCVAR